MLRHTFIIALVAVAAAGCASQQVSEDAQAPAGTPAASGTQSGGTAQASPAGQSGSMQSSSPQTAGTAPATAGERAAAAPAAARSVYYDFDRSLVMDEYRAVVESHGGYLARNPGAKVTIEGNCDERGSREYNLALGQRRADSVKAKLKLLGVSDAQVETVSWGKEKPKAKGHDETAWAENRRSDIVYTSTK